MTRPPKPTNPIDELLNIKGGDAALTALAKATFDKEGMPPEFLPSLTLYAWLFLKAPPYIPCPPANLTDCTARLNALLPKQRWVLCTPAPGVPAGGLAYGFPHSESKAGDSVTYTIIGCTYVHAEWTAAVKRARAQGDPPPDHTLAPLAQAWAKAVHKTFKPNGKKHLPPGLINTSIIISSIASDDEINATLPPNPQHQERQATMPCFIDRGEGSMLIPNVPTALFDRLGSALTRRGGGAPWETRIFFELMTGLAFYHRQDPQILLITIRQLISCLLPPTLDGPKRAWRQDLNLPLARAIKVMNTWDFLVGTERVQLANGRKFPGPNSPPDTELEFSVHLHLLPNANKGGPRIDMAIQREYGVNSAPAFRANLTLAYFWDKRNYLEWKRKGGKGKVHRIFDTAPGILRDKHGDPIDIRGEVILDRAGNPTNNPFDHRAVPQHHAPRVRHPNADHIPMLDHVDKYRLCWNQSLNGIPRPLIKSRIHDTDRALRLMADHPRSNITLEWENAERKTGRVRVLEKWKPTPPKSA